MKLRQERCVQTGHAQRAECYIYSSSWHGASSLPYRTAVTSMSARYRTSASFPLRTCGSERHLCLYIMRCLCNSIQYNYDSLCISLAHPFAALVPICSRIEGRPGERHPAYRLPSPFPTEQAMLADCEMSRIVQQTYHATHAHAWAVAIASVAVVSSAIIRVSAIQSISIE